MLNFIKGSPWYGFEYSSLPEVYVQNAGLEIAWTSIFKKLCSISSSIVLLFVTKALERLDINQQEDWILANYKIENNLSRVQAIELSHYHAN